jgi:hypothetical protein
MKNWNEREDKESLRLRSSIGDMYDALFELEQRLFFSAPLQKVELALGRVEDALKRMERIIEGIQK